MNFTRESIFISAMRSLLKTFAVVIGFVLAAFVLIMGIGFVSNTIQIPEKSELTVSADANWRRKLLPSTSNVILKMNIHGIIGAGQLKESKFKDMLLDSRTGVLEHRVKAILLHINTPGGFATDSSDIYHLLKTYKEAFNVPIFAYVDGICASGGMYIASAADQIFATPDSVIGSVGVRLGPTFNVAQAMEKIGVQSLTLTAGLNKDALNPFRHWKEGEDEYLKAILNEDYAQFVDVVTTARKRLSKEKLVQEYGANVFIAKDAEEKGYIDNGNANYNETLIALTKAAGFLENEAYQVVEISPYQSVLKELTDSKMAFLNGKVHHIFPTGSNTTTEMSGQLLYLYQPCTSFTY